MLRPHLRSKVGRRLFLSFLLAGLLPLGSLAVYAYFQVGGLLQAANAQRLRQDSKAYGMSLIQELNWRTQVLKAAASHARGVDPEAPTPDGFLGLETLQGAEHLSRAQLHHLDQGKAVLTLEQDREARLWVASHIPGQVISGRLELASLWRNDAAPENFCILDADARALFCSPSLPAPRQGDLPKLPAGQNSLAIAWRAGSEEYLASLWQARLRPAYAHSGLTVMVAESQTPLRQNLTNFRLVFFGLSTLAFGLALLLALAQIRRQMRPLEALAAGTQQLASGDFTARVQHSGNDEFGELAQAFNQMSDGLSNKFHLLEMLAELDRAILSSAEMDYLLQLVLQRIHAAIPSDFAGILRLDEEGNGLLLSPSGDQTLPSSWSCPDVAALLPQSADQAWYALEWKTLPTCLQSATPQLLTRALIFPVYINQRADSFLILAYRQAPKGLEDIVEAGRSLTDRLAVAASNLAWEEKLYHQGHYDALTDLPNRVLLRDRVEQAMMRADREQTSAAVLLIDLDNFKQINDSLGHAAGDELLVECARRLRASTRQSDTAARLGGDEFVMLIPDITRGNEPAFLDALARKLNAALVVPMLIAERTVTTPASIGIALYPDNADTFEDLLKMADAAMYASKRHQLGAYQFYSGGMNAEARNRFELTQELRAAISNDELLLYYQPKVLARSGQIVAAEALVRWRSPKRGLVPPMLFVPLLDQIGLGNWLGGWVMERACAQMAAWDRQGLPPITVSVNIAPAQFQEGHLVELIEATLSDHSMPAERLELEILEATAANDSPQIHATLTQLRAMGISIALDDFGTGYTSLVYLTQLPANVLKLDQAFIRNLTTEPRQHAVVERIIALAKVLNFEVVAEGVEEAPQMSALAEMRCDLIQGYLISRPVPPDEFAELLRANHATFV